MIDYDKMSGHEFACYLIGAAMIAGDAEGNYKEKLYRVFYRIEHDSFCVQLYSKDQYGSDIFSELGGQSRNDAYDYLQEIL